MRSNLCIGNCLVDARLYFVRNFLHIGPGNNQRLMGCDWYIVQNRMCSNAGIVKGFFCLNFKIISHSGYRARKGKCEKVAVPEGITIL